MHFLPILQFLMLPIMAISFYFTIYHTLKMVTSPSISNFKDLIFSICTFILALAITGAISLSGVTGIF